MENQKQIASPIFRFVEVNERKNIKPNISMIPSLSLTWSSDSISLRCGSEQNQYSSSLLLDALTLQNEGSKQHRSFDGTFIRREDFDSTFQTRFNDILISTLRYLEETEEKDIVKSESFLLSSAYSKALYLAWIELSNQLRAKSSDRPVLNLPIELLPTTTIAKSIQLFLLPTPLSLPSRHFITEVACNAGFEVKSIHSTAPAIVTGFLKSREAESMLAMNLGSLKLFLLEMGEEYISASIITADGTLDHANQLLVEKEDSSQESFEIVEQLQRDPAEDSIVTEEGNNIEESFDHFDDGFIARISEKVSCSDSPPQGHFSKVKKEKTSSHSLPSHPLSFTSMNLRVEASEGTMQFGLKELDEQLIQDWVASLYHISRFNYHREISESINYLEGPRIWRKVPLQQRLLCLRALKLFRKAIQDPWALFQTQNKPKGEEEEEEEERVSGVVVDSKVNEAAVLELLSFLHQSETSQNNHSVPVSSFSMTLTHPPSSQETSLFKKQLEGSPNAPAQLLEEDSEPTEPTRALPLEDTTEEEETSSPLSSFQEIPSLSQLLRQVHDYIYEKSESSLKVLTKWTANQSFSIFQQLLSQYGQERLQIEAISLDNTKRRVFVIDPISETSSTSAVDDAATTTAGSVGTSTYVHVQVRKYWKTHVLQLLKNCIAKYYLSEQQRTPAYTPSKTRSHLFDGFILWQENTSALGVDSLLKLAEQELINYCPQSSSSVEGDEKVLSDRKIQLTSSDHLFVLSSSLLETGSGMLQNQWQYQSNLHHSLLSPALTATPEEKVEEDRSDWLLTKGSFSIVEDPFSSSVTGTIGFRLAELILSPEEGEDGKVLNSHFSSPAEIGQNIIWFEQGGDGAGEDFSLCKTNPHYSLLHLQKEEEAQQQEDETAYGRRASPTPGKIVNQTLGKVDLYSIAMKTLLDPSSVAAMSRTENMNNDSSLPALFLSDRAMSAMPSSSTHRYSQILPKPLDISASSRDQEEEALRSSETEQALIGRSYWNTNDRMRETTRSRDQLFLRSSQSETKAKAAVLLTPVKNPVVVSSSCSSIVMTPPFAPLVKKRRWYLFVLWKPSHPLKSLSEAAQGALPYEEYKVRILSALPLEDCTSLPVRSLSSWSPDIPIEEMTSPTNPKEPLPSEDSFSSALYQVLSMVYTSGHLLSISLLPAVTSQSLLQQLDEEKEVEEEVESTSPNTTTNDVARSLSSEMAREERELTVVAVGEWLSERVVRHPEKVFVMVFLFFLTLYTLSQLKTSPSSGASEEIIARRVMDKSSLEETLLSQSLPQQQKEEEEMRFHYPADISPLSAASTNPTTTTAAAAAVATERSEESVTTSSAAAVLSSQIVREVEVSLTLINAPSKEERNRRNSGFWNHVKDNWQTWHQKAFQAYEEKDQFFYL